MINKKTAGAFIKAIGSNYITKISSFAKEKGVLKDDGTEYSNTIFSYVLHGKRDMPDIEDVIIECAEFYQDQREAKKRRMEDLAKRVDKTM